MNYRIDIFLITGACASGKSFFCNNLKKTFSGSKVKVHDFDEKISLSLSEGVDFFLNLAKNYLMEGKILVLCGGVTPIDLKSSKIYSEQFKIHSCLINVSPEERKRRLLERSDFFFKLTNPDNLPIEEWLNQICVSAERYKDIVKNSDTYIETDNTLINNDNSFKFVLNWLEKKIGLFMALQEYINSKNLEKTTEWMMNTTGNYQAYNPFVLPFSADPKSLCYKKFLDLGYKKDDFKNRTVADLGSCLGFFTFLSYFLGAKSCVGYEYNQDYLYCSNLVRDINNINEVSFESINLEQLPEIRKSDIIIANAIIHWIFILNRTLTVTDILKWLYNNCNYAIYFEGCVDAEDSSMKRFNIPLELFNKSLFIEEASKIFSKVEVVKDMGYSSTRIRLNLYK